MDIAALARNVSRHCRALAYLFIPLAEAADRLKRLGFRERIEENIALFCTPEQRRDRVCLRRLRRDIWYSSILYSCSPLEYFLFRFPRLSHAGRQEFLCEYERRNLYRRISACNPHEDAFWKKSAGYRLFSQYYGREVLPLDDQTPAEDFLAFVRRHPRFIVKPDSAAGGEGVHFEQVSNNTPPTPCSTACAGRRRYWSSPSSRARR